MRNLRFKQRNKFSRFKKIFKPRGSSGKPDYFLLAIIFLIVLFGLIMLSLASSVKSFLKFGDTYYLFKHQLINGLLPGIILFLILSKINYQRWERFTVLFFILSLGLLVLIFVPGLGASYGKAKSWINIAGVSIQPTEIVKLFLILSLAGWFSYRGKEMTKDFWNGLFPFAAMLGSIALLIALQPDLGTLVVVVVISLAVYFVAGARLIHIAGLVFAGLGAFGILIIQMPYLAARLMTFLHPEIDPEGISYHINQAFLAVGSGGWLGLGLGQSRQMYGYLPEVMGDSIFAIIAEELGFIFSVGLIVLFLLLAWRGLKLAQAADNDYAQYIVVGIVTWFVFQAFFNIAAMIGLMPLTGIPMPFVSYGGTALVASLAAAGILVNISRQTRI